MQKLKLDPDLLRVESFATAADGVARGTVPAYAAAVETVQTVVPITGASVCTCPTGCGGVTCGGFITECQPTCATGACGGQSCGGPTLCDITCPTGCIGPTCPPPTITCDFRCVVDVKEGGIVNNA
jgi:hypothetical protein